jgi:SAM-dependent methyltransferase
VWGAQPNRWVAAQAAGLPPGRALDLAAGEGRNAVWLAQHGWSVTAVDFAGEALLRGRERAREAGVEVDWREEDVRERPPERRAYDLVLIAYLHLPAAELAPVLEAAAEAVAAGGTLLLVGHHSRNLREGTGGPQDARLLYDETQVLEHLAGLEVEEAAPRLRDVEGAQRDAIDVVVRAHRPAA